MSVMPDGSGREPPAARLLREFTGGLGAHRLFPGEADRPAFVTACERIGAAATEALRDGPFEVEVVAELLPEDTSAELGGLLPLLEPLGGVVIGRRGRVSRAPRGPRVG